MAHERVAIEFNALAGLAFYWRHRKIAALEKCAGEAGNRHGSDLGMRLTNLKPRTTMNLNPAELLNPIFYMLDGLIENDGVYLYLVFVWLALLVIGWIFSGGLRKRMKGNSATAIPAVIITPPPIQSPSPIIGIEVEQAWNDDDETMD